MTALTVAALVVAGFGAGLIGYITGLASIVSYPALLAVMFGWGMANHAALNVLILRLAALDPARRGAIMGLNSGVTYLALFVGTSGFGPL